MRVFLDVGAHVGESLTPALDPRYRFDRVVCFEPVRACWAELERLSDRRVEICRFGLWKEEARRSIHDAGSLGASVLAEGSSGGRTEVVELRQASGWFRDELAEDDLVFLKLNCEGSECDILDDLLRSGEIRKVNSALVDFDVRKVTRLAHREREVRERLDAAGHSGLLRLKEEHKGPTHTATIDNWLREAGVTSTLPPARWRWRYVWMPGATRTAIAAGKEGARRLLPRSAYERLRRLVQRRVYNYPPDVEDPG
jgi:FkbM family methyltransferase